MPYFIVPSPAVPSCPTLSLRNLPTFRSALSCLALCCRTRSRRAFSRCLFSDKPSALSGSSLTHLALSSRDIHPLPPSLSLPSPAAHSATAPSLAETCRPLPRRAHPPPALPLLPLAPRALPPSPLMRVLPSYLLGDLTLSPALPSPFAPSPTEPSPAKAYCPLPPCHLPPYPLLLTSPAVPCPAESFPDELCPAMPSPAET